ncbi:hypothetical protein [Demequina activiva]|uniref:hypothetical protein n=1 Tax=Demequina activiva TaxID=1582364 RepID=UPI0019435260|nr:hypothetical protein [Demequina activiva]
MRAARPQRLELSGSVSGACGGSADAISVASTSFPALELRDAVRRLEEEGWTLVRKDAHKATVSRDGDEARLAIGIDP